MVRGGELMVERNVAPSLDAKRPWVAAWVVAGLTFLSLGTGAVARAWGGAALPRDSVVLDALFSRTEAPGRGSTWVARTFDSVISDAYRRGVPDPVRAHDWMISVETVEPVEGGLVLASSAIGDRWYAIVARPTTSVARLRLTLSCER